MSAKEDNYSQRGNGEAEREKPDSKNSSSPVQIRIHVVDGENSGEVRPLAKEHTESAALESEKPAPTAEKPVLTEEKPAPVAVKTVPESDKSAPVSKQSESAVDTTNDGEKYTDKTDVFLRENFDYVVPRTLYKDRYKHKHASTHNGSVRSASKQEREEADEGYIFSVPKRSKKRKMRRHYKKGDRRRGFKHLALWKRILIIAAAVLLALIIALAGTFLILNEIGRMNMHNYDGFDVTLPTQDESGNGIIPVDKSGRVITYDGVSYEFNDDLVSVVFIGADEGEGADNSHLQMADAVYILTLDTKTGNVKLLGISRDTMADVDMYSEQGKFIDTHRMQMAFSYAYGNDEVTGGKNTATALSRLFYGLPFDNYFAINMNALITLNDTIGGVTLTSSMTFTSPVDGRTIYEGDTVTLHGKEADYYVRSRDTKRLDSNNDRMKRQQEYIRAFMNSILPAVKNDLSVVSKLYDEIQVNSDTTLDLPKMTYIASTAVTKLDSASDIEYISLKGEITEGEYAELNVKNEDAIRTMLDVFYRPLANIPESLEK